MLLIALAHKIELYSSEAVSSLRLLVGVAIKVGVASKFLHAHALRGCL